MQAITPLWFTMIKAHLCSRYA